ncbi:MAG: hypothetical protein IIX69_05785 [Clostridia bacterium]|nr:hypothetical protein [Clostridia bacterium]
MKIRMLTATALAALALCPCGGTPPAGITDTPITEGSDKSVTEPVKLPEPKLTSIYELNPAHEEGSHTNETATSFLEADFRSRIELSTLVSRAQTPYYTRVKQLPDGSYILLYNDEKNGKGVRMLRSEDGVKWGEYSTVFEPYDDKLYANPDALVLDNGDILVCTAWRFSKTYYTNPMRGGISIKRSTDNGKRGARSRSSSPV